MPDERLSRLADELIPGRNGLPSASEADPAGKWLERALAAPSAKDLAASDPEAFEALRTIAAGAYTMNARVRRRITSGPQPPTATIAADAARCSAHLIATAGLRAVPA